MTFIFKMNFRSLLQTHFRCIIYRPPGAHHRDDILPFKAVGLYYYTPFTTTSSLSIDVDTLYVYYIIYDQNTGYFLCVHNNMVVVKNVPILKINLILSISI